jgi:hypothetical protein
VLTSHPQWRQRLPLEEKALGKMRREAWMQITAYIAPVSGMRALQSWAKDRDWIGRWMPEGPDVHNVLLGTYPDDPQWRAANGTIRHWDAVHGGEMPKELTHTSATYGGTGTSRDASAETETTGYVLSPRLHGILSKPRGIDFTWTDASGIAVQDPSVTLAGPPTPVMRRDLLRHLADAGLTLFWTVLIESELNSTDYLTRPGSEYRWVSASASYILNGSTIELVDAKASRCIPGPQIECPFTGLLGLMPVMASS